MNKTVKVLATDLDGTLIPLAGNTQNQADLVTLTKFLKDQKIELVFVTGRHFESVKHAILENQLPQPEWIVCDVGTTIMHRQGEAEMEVVQAYYDELALITSALSIDDLDAQLDCVSGIRKQESEKQGPFKLSYYAEAFKLDEIVKEIQGVLARLSAPYSLISSVDPFNGDGLLDLLPSGVSKAFALDWWSHYVNIDHQGIVFAGDSGNDLAALTAGYRAVVVDNAAEDVKAKAREAHAAANWSGRLFIASRRATSGVLEGIEHLVSV